jgi:cysteinyl-tRNA synthetase
MIRIHNSMGGAKEELQPLAPGRIGIYVCGDTVYDLAHMGHARSKIVFDVVRRYLMHSATRSTSCATSPILTTRSFGARRN